jgi:hypothetical protein
MKKYLQRIVVGCVAVSITLGVATAANKKPASSSGKKNGATVQRIGQIQSGAIKESSGIIASRKNPGILWTHNDQGGKPQIFAINRDGLLLGQYHVNTPNDDWEDIAIDNDGHLYIGGIGNNDLLKTELKVYQVNEPEIRVGISGQHGRLFVNSTWQLRFPGKPFDCESLFIYENKGYVIDKLSKSKEAHLFSFPLTPGGGTAVMEQAAVLPINHPVTGADLSLDGQNLAVISKGGLFLFDIKGNFANISNKTKSEIKLPKGQFEAVCFVPDGLVMTAETGEIYFHRRP